MRPFHQQILLFLALPLVVAGGRASQADTAPLEPASFGYSRAILQGLNEADFRSAMLVYARIISNNAGVKTRSEQQIFDGVADMTAALRSGSINLVTAPSREILSMSPADIEQEFVAAANAGATGEEFVLVVRADRGIERLAQLKDHSIAMWDSPTAALGQDWLDILLARESLGTPAAFFRQVRYCAKPGAAVLPVYFRQMDAGLATRRAFALLCEMNPRLAVELRIVAVSPRVQSLLTAFRRGINPQLRTSILSTMFSIGSTPAGRQVLMLYQTESLAFCDPEVIGATRQLLAEHQRLCAGIPRSPATDPPAATP